MKTILMTLIACLACNTATASLWQDTSDIEQRQLRGSSTLQAQQDQIFRFDAARLLMLDMAALSAYLDSATPSGSPPAVIIPLPLPNGAFSDYYVYNSPVMASGLAAKYPEIRTFKVVAADNPSHTGRIDVTPQGFHAVLTRAARTIFIDPLGTANHYQSYYKRDYAARKIASGQQEEFVCRSAQHQTTQSSLAERLTRTAYVDSFGFAPTFKRLSSGKQVKTYRLAIAATGEFTQFHGGTKAKGLAALVTGINRINEVYERDLAVKLELITDNDKLVYTDPDTDPFDSDGDTDLSDQVSDVIADVIGLDKLDVGHIIHGQGVGGQAGLGVVCNPDEKAIGETASDKPINDAFFIDFVAHELGHQFGSQHSFNGTTDSCGGGNRATQHAYEPASGSTIMGYTGICGEEDLQLNSDAYFHSDSIDQIQTYLASQSCGVPIGAVNAIPVANAGDNDTVHYVPLQTPFALTGSGSDTDGDALTYTWEQLDLGPETSGKADQTDDGKRPIFRSFMPGNSPTRIFPQLSDILAGTTTYGELMPSTARDLNFRLTVRDGKGGVASDERKLQTVAAAGPFKVTLPGNSSWTNSTQTVTWDVANTTAAPLSCANVKIELSTDNGTSFPITLLASTENDGSASVNVPATTTSNGRVRVSCLNQPFFAINSAKIAIGIDAVDNGSGSGGSGSNTSQTPPVANPDRYEIRKNSDAATFTVLDNDTDAENDALIIVSINSISNGGAATISADGQSISYQPANGFKGTEIINYTVRDAKGDTASTNVQMVVKKRGGGGSSSPYLLLGLLLLTLMRRIYKRK